MICSGLNCMSTEVKLHVYQKKTKYICNECFKKEIEEHLRENKKMQKEYKVYDASGIEIFASDKKLEAESFTYGAVANPQYKTPLFFIRGELITIERKK